LGRYQVHICSSSSSLQSTMLGEITFYLLDNQTVLDPNKHFSSYRVNPQAEVCSKDDHCKMQDKNLQIVLLNQLSNDRRQRSEESIYEFISLELGRVNSGFYTLYVLCQRL